MCFRNNNNRRVIYSLRIRQLVACEESFFCIFVFLLFPVNVLDSFDPSTYILGYGKTPFVGCWSATENISLNLEKQTTDSAKKGVFLFFSTAHNFPNMGRGREKIPTQNLLFAPPFMGTLKVEENSTVRKLHRHRSPEFCAARKKHPRIAWVDCSRGLRNHKSPKTTHVPHNDENYYVDMSNLNKCGVDLSIDRLTDGLMA